MPSYGTTQKKRSPSETQGDSAVKSQKVTYCPPKLTISFILPTTVCLSSFEGETGLLVGKIGVGTPFSGYAKNKQQTERKKLRDVFEKGDVYFNSGDLLRIDNEGFVYFQDRIGDTFR